MNFTRRPNFFDEILYLLVLFLPLALLLPGSMTMVFLGSA